jgi:hypothetical protein
MQAFMKRLKICMENSASQGERGCSHRLHKQDVLIQELIILNRTNLALTLSPHKKL